MPTKLVAVKVDVEVLNVRPELVVVDPSPLPIIICPAVLFIVFCFPAKAVSNPVIFDVANAGICVSVRPVIPDPLPANSCWKL